MSRNTLPAAALAACALILSHWSFAEESPAFAARFAALQQQAGNAAFEHTAASQSASESQHAHAKILTEHRKGS